MEKKKVIVIGAGVSGLSAAAALKKAGADVTVLEKEARAGGVISTFSKDGFRAESGSNTVMVHSQKTIDFLKEFGLYEYVQTSAPTAKKRFFVRYGKPQAVPMGPLQLLTTKLFTLKGKLRFLWEPFTKGFDPESDPSVAEFTIRRLGREALDYMMNPFMAGIYGANPEKLSIKYGFPPFWNLVTKYGSIIGGAMKAAKAKKREGNIFKPMMISFDGGMKTLPERLTKYLGDSLKTEANVISIDAGEQWKVAWSTPEEDTIDNYDAIIFAVPAPELEKLPLCGPLAQALEPVSKIEYAPIATLTLGFKRSDIAHPLDGFGVLTPKKENLSILGSLFVSSIFRDRAPEGYVTLTNYLGGMRNPKIPFADEETIYNLAMADLKKLLGANAEPVFKKLFVWKHGIAQYNVGYGDFLEAMDDAEKQFPNMALIGAYRGGVGVSTCIENGLAAAKKLELNL